MSGHSKWSTIKHKKAKTDAQRGKVFTKIAKEITTAAKIGGGDPNGNPRLRLAVDKARQANMPNDNVERAIKKGTGELEGMTMEELSYEGYGPGGVAVLVDVMTDNKNRTLSEVRTIFTKGGGNLGSAGCVGWLFKKKGLFAFEKTSVSEEKLTNIAVEAGAEDISSEENTIEVFTKPEDFEKVGDAFKKAKIEPANSEITMIPSNTVKLTGEDAHKVLALVSALEDNDDVQAVHANFDIPDEIINEEAEK